MPPGDRNVNNLATTTLWWDTEFWNKRVVDVYVPENDQRADQTPFPRRLLHIDPQSGRIEVVGLSRSQQAPYVVLDTQRADMRPVGRRVESAPWGLDLVAAERPYRTAWATFGLGPGDALYASRAACIRVFETPCPRHRERRGPVPGNAGADRPCFLARVGSADRAAGAELGRDGFGVGLSVARGRHGRAATRAIAADGGSGAARQNARQAAAAGTLLLGRSILMLPSITIVTPCLNAADTLEETHRERARAGLSAARARRGRRRLDRRHVELLEAAARRPLRLRARRGPRGRGQQGRGASPPARWSRG